MYYVIINLYSICLFSSGVFTDYKRDYSSIVYILFHIDCAVDNNAFMPPPFEEWWRGIKCYPCPSVSPSVCRNLVSAQ